MNSIRPDPHAWFDNSAIVGAVFDAPGDSVVRVMAHDGGVAATGDVHVRVTAPRR